MLSFHTRPALGHLVTGDSDKGRSQKNEGLHRFHVYSQLNLSLYLWAVQITCCYLCPRNIEILYLPCSVQETHSTVLFDLLMDHFRLIWRRPSVQNGMNGVLGHLCAHNRLNWARRTSWGWWDEWDALPSRRRIRNSSPGGLRPSTLPLDHGCSDKYCIIASERGRKKLFLWNLEARVGFEPPHWPNVQQT